MTPRQYEDLAGERPGQRFAVMRHPRCLTLSHTTQGGQTTAHLTPADARQLGALLIAQADAVDALAKLADDLAAPSVAA